MIARILVSSAVAFMLASGSAACGRSGGSDRRDAVVVRVGGTPITSATLAHWMRVMAPEHVVLRPPRYLACIARLRTFATQMPMDELKRECRQRYEILRHQVLTFLISSQWLIDEAVEEGMSVSGREVAQRLAERKRSFPNGEAEFNESLRAIAHSIADVELEIRAELAAEKIRRRLKREAPKVTSAVVAAYYRKSVAHFHIPERRDFYIAENFPSAAVARKVMAEVRAGKSLARTSLSESLLRKPFSDYRGEKRTITEAIFKAPLRVLTGPIRLNNLYFLIEVTRIHPAHVETLAHVRDGISRQLARERRRQTRAAFVAAWRRKWTARTHCVAGYIVQKCREYSGLRTREDPLQLK